MVVRAQGDTGRLYRTSNHNVASHTCNRCMRLVQTASRLPVPNEAKNASLSRGLKSIVPRFKEIGFWRTMRGEDQWREQT